jgi:hypothetical protein
VTTAGFGLTTVKSSFGGTSVAWIRMPANGEVAEIIHVPRPADRSSVVKAFHDPSVESIIPRHFLHPTMSSNSQVTKRT